MMTAFWKLLKQQFDHYLSENGWNNNLIRAALKHGIWNPETETETETETEYGICERRLQAIDL